jgi:hypothetical protein
MSHFDVSPLDFLVQMPIQAHVSCIRDAFEAGLLEVLGVISYHGRLVQDGVDPVQ